MTPHSGADGYAATLQSDTRGRTNVQGRQYSGLVIVDFEGTVYRWQARPDASWFFVDLPGDVSEMIREMQDPALARGFGSVRVRVSIGGSTWKTSIFPSSGTGSYVLPLKRAVRDAEDLTEGGTARARVELVDL